MGYSREERLIVALDLNVAAHAEALVATLGDAAQSYKLGLEAFCSYNALEFVSDLSEAGKNVFVDLKLHDIPETVKRAVASIATWGAAWTTVHASRPVMEAAANAARASGSRLKVLAVTVLTSMDAAALLADGVALPSANDRVGAYSGTTPEGVAQAQVEYVVVQRALAAKACGCHGVIASPREAALIRQAVGPDFLIVTPGIRPADHTKSDDQKRVATPESAFRDGADCIVVGRPIRDAADPRAVAQAIQRTLLEIFPSTALAAAGPVKVYEEP